MQAHSLRLESLTAAMPFSAPLRWKESLSEARRALGAWALAAQQNWRERREARHLKRALAPLDAGTLRDLGLSQHRRDPLHDHPGGPWKRWMW